MQLPNIWGHGAIFCHSGLDGETSFYHGLAGSLTGDGIGVMFHTLSRQRIELRFPLINVGDIDYHLVASDILKMDIHLKHKRKGGGAPLDALSDEEPPVKPLEVICYRQDVIIGQTSSNAPATLAATGVYPTQAEDGLVTLALPGEWFVLRMEQGDVYRFALAYSDVSLEDALSKAEQGMAADLDTCVQQKLAFFGNLPSVEGLTELEEKTLYHCYSVMKSQFYSPEGRFTSLWTTPDRLPHRKIWLWDSIFHSFGHRYIDIQAAKDSLFSILSTQMEDGFIPIMSEPRWSHPDETQPPVIAWGFYDLYSYTDDKEMLRQVYDRLEAYLRWNIEHRDSNGNHLFEWRMRKFPSTSTCGESGMDNSPRFDTVDDMDCIDFSCFMANEARHMAKIAEIIGKEEGATYWSQLYEAIKEAVNTVLWDEEDGFYYDRLVESGELKKVKAVSSFLPLFAGICNEHQAEALKKHLMDETSFGTNMPVPSISLDDPTYGSDMFRGPVWICYNYLILSGLREYGFTELAEDIESKTLDTIAFWYGHDGVVYEFYDSQDRISPSRFNRKGKNLQPYLFWVRMQCIRDFGWTATLYVRLMMERARR